MIHSRIHVLHTERDGGLSEGFGALVGQHDGDVMVGVGDNMVDWVSHTGKGRIGGVEHAVFLDIDEVLLHLSVLVRIEGMDAVDISGIVSINPYQHTHIAIMGIIGNGEYLFVRYTASNLDTMGIKRPSNILTIVALEVVYTVAIVVDGNAEGGLGGGVVLILVVGHDNGEGVSGATTYVEGGYFGIERVVRTKF